MAHQRPQPPAPRPRSSFEQTFDLAFDAIAAAVLSLLSALLRGIAALLQRPSSRQ